LCIPFNHIKILTPEIKGHYGKTPEPVIALKYQTSGSAFTIVVMAETLPPSERLSLLAIHPSLDGLGYGSGLSIPGISATASGLYQLGFSDDLDD
jgi:hypothetical protein